MKKIFYNDLNPLNFTNPKIDQGYYQEIIDSINKLLNTMIAKHNKVFFVRFDLTYPQHGNYPNDNQHLSKFTEGLIRHLNRKKYDPKYLWVREQSSSINHHYHFIMLLNGNKTQNPYGLFEKAQSLWGQRLNVDGSGLVHFGECRMIRRSSPEYKSSLQECMDLASYLAKVYSKGNVAPRVRQMGKSKC